MVTELFLASGQIDRKTDRHDESFRNFANATNKINILLCRHKELVQREKERGKR